MDLAERFTELPHNQWVQPSRGFIQKEHLRLMDEALRDPDFLLHALGALRKRKVLELRQSKSLQGFIDCFVRNSLAVQRRVIAGRFLDSEIQMIVWLFRQVSHLFIEATTQVGGLTQKLHLARRGPQQAEETIHCCGFARAVLAHQREKIAVTHFQT
jgi:hypothetical protein